MAKLLAKIWLNENKINCCSQLCTQDCPRFDNCEIVEISIRRVGDSMQNRWKSPVLWGAVLSLVALLLRKYTNIEISEQDKIWDLVSTILIAGGILNNPTNKDGF